MKRIINRLMMNILIITLVTVILVANIILIFAMVRVNNRVKQLELSKSVKQNKPDIIVIEEFNKDLLKHFNHAS